jgi:hypothetical protein
VIDALAGAGGALASLAGETVRATIELDAFPRPAGEVSFRASYPNGDASFDGEVIDPGGRGRFLVARGPASVRLVAVDNEAARTITTFLPAYGNLSKDRDRHAAAEVRITELRLPFDGQIPLVKADATVDPGEFGFQIDGGLKSVLKLAGQATEGTALERFEAVVVEVDNGIATYNNLKLPLGEFEFESSGRFDLVERTEEITLWAPLAAIASEGIDLPIAGGNDVINPDALVPIRRRGPMGEDNPWVVDITGARGSLFRSGDELEDAIKDGIRDLLGGG